MKSRATALTLALLLLATAASATPGVCCCPPASDPAKQTIRSLDCCEAMLECPTSPQSALTAPVRGAATAPRAGSISNHLIIRAFRFRRLAVSLQASGPPGGSTLLYRLHAQLLI